MKALDEKYLRLITKVPLLPIETEKEYLRARSLLHELVENDENLAQTEIGYAKVLMKLVQEYSNHKCQGMFTEQTPGSEILQSLMDDHELSQTDIADLTKMQKQNVNAYLKNRRSLPREAREILGKRFKVNPELFTGKIPSFSPR
jgi:antitoxin component HigA of HigAB toxin-antitoxin module